MDCDTTGIEPDFSLVKFKELVGGGQMTIVNRSVPLALRTLGYAEPQVEQIDAYIAEKATIIGAPGLKDEHLPVFDVAVGERAISHTGHIDMMAATQPFISGAISKTVNLPQSATVDDIADAYTRGWKGGLKALAIYRDGSKTAQALRTDAQEEKGAEAEVAAAAPERKRMPRERESVTHKFSIAGHEGYITAGKYQDGTVGEIFLTDIGKEGSTMRGLMNAFATAISIGLQYGVPLETSCASSATCASSRRGSPATPRSPSPSRCPTTSCAGWRAASSRTRNAGGPRHPHPGGAGQAGSEPAARLGSRPTRAGGGNGHSKPGNGNGVEKAKATGGEAVPPSAAFTDTPPVVPAKMSGLDLGPACEQCGGMMQRTGTCYTCSSAAATTPAAADRSCRYTAPLDVPVMPNPVLLRGSGGTRDFGANPYVGAQALSAPARQLTPQADEGDWFASAHAQAEGDSRGQRHSSSQLRSRPPRRWRQGQAAAAPPGSGDRSSWRTGNYVNPFAVVGWSVGRTDMGVDYMPIRRQSVVAIGAAKILGSSNHSSWPGGGFLWYRLLSGDHAGAVVYVAEHLSEAWRRPAQRSARASRSPPPSPAIPGPSGDGRPHRGTPRPALLPRGHGNQFRQGDGALPQLPRRQTAAPARARAHLAQRPALLSPTRRRRGGLSPPGNPVRGTGSIA